MIRAIVIWLALVAASGAAAQSCSEIRFARGTVSGEISGQVSDGQPLCFTFRSGASQTARLQLFGSSNACFSVEGIVDCQTDFSFRTRAQSYRVGVFQLTRSPGAELFTLRLTIR